MTKQTLTRRQLLRHGSVFAAMPALYGCDSAVTGLCSDPDLMSRGEEHMRKTLRYAERSDNAGQTCNNCQFFSAGADRLCGDCQILNGWVSEQGYCTSWALRA